MQEFPSDWHTDRPEWMLSQALISKNRMSDDLVMLYKSIEYNYVSTKDTEANLH